MKNKNRNKLTIFIVLIVLFTYTYIKIFSYKKVSLPNMDKSIENIFKKTITQDAIIKKIKEKQELITMEVELNNTIILDNSWGNLDVFKKVVSIDFYGTGIYVVDLAKIKKENIIVQPSNTITIQIPPPKIKSITLNEEKTTFKTENGLLRFGEIKITPAENQILNKKAKDKMKEELNKKYLIKSTLSNSEKAIKKTIQSILSTYKNYNIIVKFIDS